MSGVAEDPAFEALLEFLERSRGLDFTRYKRPSLQRRFRHRMEAVGAQSFGDYLDYLEVHSDEYEQLFEMLLINVTEFFRDHESWEHLCDSVLPDLLAAKETSEPVRVWSAGCATGQEAYTTAMVFAELMGLDAFRERVKIYATDIDEDALNKARLATYKAKETESVPAELRERYFERANQQLAFRKDLCRTVIFVPAGSRSPTCPPGRSLRSRARIRSGRFPGSRSRTSRSSSSDRSRRRSVSAGASPSARSRSHRSAAIAGGSTSTSPRC